jgi:hypothetical protein
MLPVSNDYQGEIISAVLSEDQGRISAIVHVRPDGSAETARWRGTFDETEIRNGTNQGRQWGEITAECLGEFGITDFARIGDMKGMKCSFGIKHSPGKDKEGKPKIWVEVNFIHPIRNVKPVTSQGLASLNRFKGAALAAARKTNAPRQQAAPAASNRGDAYEHDDFADYGPDPLA